MTDSAIPRQSRVKVIRKPLNYFGSGHKRSARKQTPVAVPSLKKRKIASSTLPPTKPSSFSPEQPKDPQPLPLPPLSETAMTILHSLEDDKHSDTPFLPLGFGKGMQTLANPYLAEASTLSVAKLPRATLSPPKPPTKRSREEVPTAEFTFTVPHQKLQSPAFEDVQPSPRKMTPKQQPIQPSPRKTPQEQHIPKVQLFPQTTPQKQLFPKVTSSLEATPEKQHHVLEKVRPCLLK